MDAHELRARTSWGLIADPADTLVWRLQHELGLIEALGQVLGSHNIRALGKRLSATLMDGEVSLESLRTYRSRYSPDRVRRARSHNLVGEGKSASCFWHTGCGHCGELEAYPVRSTSGHHLL